MLAHYETPAAAMRAHEELFGYWAKLKAQPAGGRIPGRRHIHPADFKRHLPAVSLIDVRRGTDGSKDYRLRLAGTDLYGVYGQEITGKSLLEVFQGEAAATGAASSTRWSRRASRLPASTRWRGGGWGTSRSCGCGCRWPATGGRWT
jgi:hypothetical protein